MNVLMWFQTNLRATDNAALTHASARGAVVPLYIVDPDLWARPDHSARQYAFVSECLEDLRTDLSALGVPLLIRLSAPLAVLERLCIKHAITEIVIESPAPAQIHDWAAANGIQLSEIKQDFNKEPLPAPALRCPPDLISTPTPPAQMLRLAADPCPHRQRGGRSQALDLLEIFLTSRGESYHRAQGQPIASERASSRLSPHLTHGSLALAEVKTALQTRQAERPSGRWTSALVSFKTQLALREITDQAFEIPKLNNQSPALSAWLAGETGLPFLDAVMRYLAATGWLNHHLRSLTLSLACHHLGIDWQAASLALARRLTDYDPALFWPYATQIAGQTASAPRLFHPIKQGLELDPSGAFTRRWLPELAQVPDSALQTPWKWVGAPRLLGRRYPEPLIDIATAHTAAREAIWARFGRPMRALSPPTPQLIETQSQPAKGQLRLDF